MASLSQSFEEEKYICQGRLTDWMAKVSELTKGPAIHGIKLPKRCLQQENFAFTFLHAIVRLREDMISNMKFVHKTSGMLHILKTIII